MYIMYLRQKRECIIYLLGSGFGTGDRLVVRMFGGGLVQQWLEVLFILRQSLNLRHQNRLSAHSTLLPLASTYCTIYHEPLDALASCKASPHDRYCVNDKSPLTHRPSALDTHPHTLVLCCALYLSATINRRLCASWTNTAGNETRPPLTGSTPTLHFLVEFDNLAQTIVFMYFLK